VKIPVYFQNTTEKFMIFRTGFFQGLEAGTTDFSKHWKISGHLSQALEMA
jgi:hypothetical protein